tara:strand:- start:9644 stop:10279 length:636 start_codon:yes stop_codon:yes gene_type:complete
LVFVNVFHKQGTFVLEMLQNRKYFLIILCLSLADISINAQTPSEKETKEVEQTSTNVGVQKKIKNYRSQPQKAFAASLFVPGLGQVLNKQAWKSPIALGAICGSGYVLWQNQNYVSRLKEAIEIRFEVPGGIDEFNATYSDSQLFSLENEYTRLRDYSFLALIGIHLLQCIDAYAAGFLVDFDVSADLNLSASFNTTPEAPIGAKISLSWP